MLSRYVRMCCVKHLAILRLSIFIHVDILVLVSEFVVVLFYLSSGYFI